MEVGFGVEPAADTRLVGHDRDAVAQRPRCAAQVEDARHEFELVDAVDVAMVDVDDAVAVQQQAWRRHAQA